MKICLTLAIAAGLASAQNDSWLTYHGDYSGKRHSSLAAITPENVSKLQQAWRFQTGQTQAIKASPILVDGVIFITLPDHIWALDARTAKEIWHYQSAPNSAFHIGHRGAAVYKDTVYLTTPDCHLIALNAKDGKVKWDVVIADSNKGYWSTNAPLIVKNHVLVGVSGDFDNVAGQLTSVDADTGKVQWIFYSTPPPGGTEPNSGGATGGQMWTTGTLLKLSTESGLLGISGVSNDFREIETEATRGNDRAKLAIDVFVESIRHYIGAHLVVLGGCDALVFTGGIGENAIALREQVCRDLDFAGILLDGGKNVVRGREEKISAVESDADIWVIPANEELIVAQQTLAVLTAN
jgi:outer membrane protein assembly factor BamB